MRRIESAPIPSRSATAIAASTINATVSFGVLGGHRTSCLLIRTGNNWLAYSVLSYVPLHAYAVRTNSKHLSRKQPTMAIDHQSSEQRIAAASAPAPTAAPGSAWPCSRCR